LGLGLNIPENEAGIFSLWLNYVMASGDKQDDNKDKSFRDFSALGLNTSDRLFGEIYGKSNTLGIGAIPRGQGLDTGTEGLGLTVLNFGGEICSYVLCQIFIGNRLFHFQAFS
jgi:hypothetical protein